MSSRPIIVFGVTADQSLGLLRGFPGYMAKNGWDVHVVSSPGQNLNALTSEPGVKTHSLRMSRNPSPLLDLRSLMNWVMLLRRIRPDVVSIGTPKAGLLGGLAGWITRVPTRIYMLRGLRLETIEGPQRKVLYLMERLTMASAHHVLSVSPSLTNRAVELGLVRKNKISVLGSGSSNGVKITRFMKSNFSAIQIQELKLKLALIPGVPVIGFVGRLTVDKGLAVLSAARVELVEAGTDFQLLLVGGTDAPKSGSDLDFAFADGRPIVRTGHVVDTSIYYQLMDVLCLPTLREGFPNVVLEAAAAGIPTITTDATGSIDSVVDGKTGRVVSKGNSSALAGALRGLLDDGILRTQMGLSALDYVQAHFAQETVWKNLSEYYAIVQTGRTKSHPPKNVP